MNKKNMNQTETGRSMVEMLGVLAIIGVLSVGGIAGYTSAMNKHRANDTVQRLMRRAVIISSQKQLGQTATLSGFDNNDGAYAITLSEGAAANEPTFTLQAANVPKTECEKINALSWPSATISPTTCNSGTQDMTFTFNNDLSAGGSCTLSVTDCASGALVEGICACAPATDGQSCTSYTSNECGSGYYCEFNIPSKCEDDDDRGTGTCTTVGSGTEVTTLDKTYLKSSSPMNWWSANSWCLGNDKHLVMGTIAGHPLNEPYEHVVGQPDLYEYFGGDIAVWTGYGYGSCEALGIYAGGQPEYDDGVHGAFNEHIRAFSRGTPYIGANVFALCE